MVSGTDIKPAGRLDGLQVLRGVAALLVGWCHLKYNLGLTHEQLVRLPLVASDLGAIGVDIFFVISGFVIAMTAENTGGNGRAFFAHRIARIVPLYFTVSSYMLVLIVLWGVTTHEIDISQWLSFRLIFNTYAFIPIFDGPNFTSPACLNGWTLSFEMWFYVCFAALIKFCGGRLAGKLFPVVMPSALPPPHYFTTQFSGICPNFCLIRWCSNFPPAACSTMGAISWGTGCR
jgi:peptidoglycan/LPS O-acetylase OafA/YrhL